MFPLQSSDVGQGEVWLLLTDPSLQEESPETPCRRTAALCVNTACVLTSSVLKAINSPAACRMSFRDAIKEHGSALLWLHVQFYRYLFELSDTTACTSPPDKGAVIVHSLLYLRSIFKMNQRIKVERICTAKQILYFHCSKCDVQCSGKLAVFMFLNFILKSN